jgi:hypothetical protein
MNIQQIKLTAITKTRTENLLTKREELNAIMAEAKQTLDRINEELMVRVTQEETGKLIVGEKTVQIVNRTNFTNVPLDFARPLMAVREVIDPTVLKPLYNKGVEIPGVTYAAYILVK